MVDDFKFLWLFITALPKEIDEYFKYLEEGGGMIDIFAG